MTTQTLSVGSEPEIEIERVGGDLIIAGWERAELEARSDDQLEFEQDGEEVTLSCGSDLNISVPRDATLTISYVGGDVKVENLNGEIEITFVGGDAILRNLTGHVTVGSSIGGELQMENVSKISMNAGRGMPASDISEKIQRKVEAATRRADKKIRDAEHKMRRAEFIAVERKFRHGIPPIPPLPPIPPIPSIPPLPPMGRGASRRRVVNMNFSGAPEASQSVSDEERMTILKMLQEKKITSEEADKLLAALEGGS